MGIDIDKWWEYPLVAVIILLVVIIYKIIDMRAFGNENKNAVNRDIGNIKDDIKELSRLVTDMNEIAHDLRILKENFIELKLLMRQQLDIMKELTRKIP